MNTMDSTLQDRSSTGEEQRDKHSTGGFFRICQSNGRCIIKLKGAFNDRNIVLVCRALLESGSSRRKYIEIDMNAVDMINMRAMALIAVSVKKLKDNGINTKIAGLEEENRELAHDLGVHYIAQIM